MSNVDVIEKEKRNSLAGRIEVLDRVKELILLPNSEIATTKQVAEFYGVKHNTLKLVVFFNREELESDGMRHMKYSEIKGLINLTLNLELMKELGIGKVGANIFTKRAILRVGMLLRDSEVAKEVRTQLLNIEEHTVTEVKTYEIDYEQDLHLKLGQAIANRDALQAVQITQEIEDYKNRHTIEKAERYDKFLDQEGLIAFDTIAKQFFGTTAIKLRQELQERGILGRKKIDGAWSPNSGYEKYFVKSPYHTGWSTTWHTKVNHAGLDFILNILK